MVNKDEYIKIFPFFKMADAAILDCRIHKILLADGVCRAQTHHCTKFCQYRSFSCGDIAILWIFKMAAAAILDFWNREILLFIGIQRVETHQPAKFSQNRSIGCEDIKIFWIFKMTAAYLPQSPNGGISTKFCRAVEVVDLITGDKFFRDRLMYFDFVGSQKWLVPKAKGTKGRLWYACWPPLWIYKAYYRIDPQRVLGGLYRNAIFLELL